MQEPVYVLHLITCHGRIMPRLAELLFNNVVLTTKIPITQINICVYRVCVMITELLAKCKIKCRSNCFTFLTDGYAFI